MKSSADLLAAILPAGLAVLLALPCLAQDIEPRRWSHLPIGANFAGAGYGFSTGEIRSMQDNHTITTTETTR